MRAWLAVLTWFYPCYWAAQFCLYVAPALAQVAVRGEKLEALQVSWLGANARSGQEPRSRRANPWPVAAGLAVAVGLLGWKRRRAAGLAIAMLGQTALAPLARRALWRQDWTAESLLPAGAMLLLVAFGLRWVAAGERWWQRVWLPAAGFYLPWAGLWWVLGVPRQSLMALAPGLAAGIAAALWRSRPHSAPAWRWTALGASATAALAAVAGVVGPALEQASELSRRAAWDSAPPLPSGLPYPTVLFQKGVNFTAEWPDTYGSEGSRRALEALPSYGVNAVALVPYGFAPRAEPRISLPGPRGGWESDGGIEYLSRLAHALGLRVMLKPQLWVGGRSYPGDLDFPAPPERDAWFRQYRLFLEHYARLAARIHADVFCIGVELSKMTPYEQEWRQLIARVRELYPGPLVYGASWGPEFESVRFWDALDYIGLNNYYPLPDDLATGEVAAKVEAVQRRFGRPVVFTEAGFSSYAAPHRQPWDETPRRLAPDEQARCYEAVLGAFYNRPWFQGVYWWKVGTNGAGGAQDGSHTPWGKPAMQVLARWFRAGAR
jgi:hypothetical protein